MTQITLSQESVLNALRSVQDPDLKQDLVTLGMIRDLKIEGNWVAFRVVLTTPACPMKALMEKQAKEAVAAIPGVERVDVKMDSEVKPRVASPAGGTGRGMTAIPGVAHIIAVSSGKGGVGKSTVAVNLATALALEGAKVGLLDSDVYGPNVPTMMGVTSQPTISQHPEKGEIFNPPTAHGVKVMSMGFLIADDQPVIWRGPMLHSIVNQFCYKVDWGSLDYLVVDMPPGTGDVQLSLAQLVPITGAVMVTTPQEVAMQDVRKAFHMFEKVRVPVLGLVENMSYFKCEGCDRQHFLFGEDGGKSLSKKFNVPLLAQVPMVGRVREGGDEGRPIVMRDPSSEVAMKFRELARSVAQQVSIHANSQKNPEQVVQIGKF